MAARRATGKRGQVRAYNASLTSCKRVQHNDRDAHPRTNTFPLLTAIL